MANTRKAMATIFQAMSNEEIEIDLGLALRTKLNHEPPEVSEQELSKIVLAYVPGEKGKALLKKILA